MSFPSPKEFKEKIDEYFSFLTRDLGFKFFNEKYSDYGYKITYESPCCRVSFIMEKKQLFIGIAPTQGQGKEIDLGHILLYKDPKSNFEYAFDPKGLVESEPRRLATLLKQNCFDILKGNFSDWPRIIEFRERRAEERWGSKSNA